MPALCRHSAGMAPKGAPREKKFTMLLSDDENAMLSALADLEGMSAATWLRRLIRERYVASTQAQRELVAGVARERLARLEAPGRRSKKR